jgi:hypothetical protein
MTSRRVFIKSASALSAAVFVKGPLTALASPQVIGLQLYTVRDAMGKDPLGTLAQVAQIGYNSVDIPELGNFMGWMHQHIKKY